MIDDQLIATSIHNALQQSLFAGAAVLIGTADSIDYQKAFGAARSHGFHLERMPEPEVMTLNHAFDLASLTKIFATTYAMMALHSDHLIQLDEPLRRYLPDIAKGSLQPITLRQILAHTSGLPPWIPTYCLEPEASPQGNAQHDPKITHPKATYPFSPLYPNRRRPPPLPSPLPQLGGRELSAHKTTRPKISHPKITLPAGEQTHNDSDWPTSNVSRNGNARQDLQMTPAWIPWLANRPLPAESGTQRVYSDLGFMLLPELISRVTGIPFADYLQQRIYQPLGLSNTLFCPPSNPPCPMVATSQGNPYERQLVQRRQYFGAADIDPASQPHWRQHTLHGEVNDGNAYHTYAGIAGHAGLFGTVSDLAVLLQALLQADSGNSGDSRDSRLFSPDTLNLFMNPAPDTQNGLGWELDAHRLQAQALPNGSAGHTGFTGTHFIINRRLSRFYILLTNRQHLGLLANGSYPDLRPLRSLLSGAIFPHPANS